MIMIAAGDVFRKMDVCGEAGKRFLFAVDFELEEGFFIEDPLEQTDVLFDVRGISNASGLAPSGGTGPFRIISSDRKAYMDGFSTVRAGLERGDTFLINYTARTEIDPGMPLMDVFLRSRAPYRLYVPGRFVCFSPECFVRISDCMIRSFPMKGTIDASVPDAERILMEDYKEQCEHFTITDLIRNDLNAVSSGVKVDRFRYVDRISTHRGEILQTSTEISGELPSGWEASAGTLLSRILPAGSICGAPRKSTLEIIRRSEGSDRGFYTGVFGYFDGSTLDTAVMIRFIEQDAGGRFFFRSGGGVTINSDAEEEYGEVLEKVYLPFSVQHPSV